MRQLAVIGLVVVLGVVSGCSVTIGGGGGGGGVWDPAPRGDDTTIAEIDAAASLTFDNAKEASFKNIAARPNLSGREQSYLIHKSMRSLSFDNAKEHVMLALIANPGFLSEGKKAILDNLNRLSFDSAKERVLKALNDRGYVPSQDEVEVVIPQEPGVIIIEPTYQVEGSMQTEL